MLSIKNVLNYGSSLLRKIDNPILNSEIILCYILKCKKYDLYLNIDNILTNKQYYKFLKIIKKRLLRVPLQYLIKEVEFMNLKLSVDNRVLIPRPETELLVEIACKKLKKIINNNNTKKYILDLGTGSGAIAISIAKEFFNNNIKILAVDKSLDALSVAKKNSLKNNILKNKLQFKKSFWFKSINKFHKYDLIISNPPYLSFKEWTLTSPEIKFFEPKKALISKKNGLYDILNIIHNANKFLKNKGYLLIEIGINHYKYLYFLLKKKYKYIYHKIFFIKDYRNFNRFLILEKI